MIEKLEFYSAGCPRSKISGKNLKKAIQQTRIDIDFEPIDDPKLHRENGINAYPAIKINGEVKSEGVFLSVEDCVNILSLYLK